MILLKLCCYSLQFSVRFYWLLPWLNLCFRYFELTELLISDYGQKCSMWQPLGLEQWNGSRWARTWCRSTSPAWGTTPSWCSTSPPTTARWTRSWTCGSSSLVSNRQTDGHTVSSIMYCDCVTGTRIGQASECFVYWKDPSTSDTWGLNFTSPIDAKQFRECCVSIYMILTWLLMSSSGPIL